MKLIYALILAIAFTGTGVGCGTVFEKPQGLKDDLAYAAANWKAATLSATDLCSRHVLTEAQCGEAETASTSFETAIKLSQTALSNGDTTTAQSQYQIALKALIGLQKLVAAHNTQSQLEPEGMLV